MEVTVDNLKDFVGPAVFTKVGIVKNKSCDHCSRMFMSISHLQPFFCKRYQFFCDFQR